VTWRNLGSWRNIRRLYQVFFLGLFLALFFASSYRQIKHYPVSLFLQADPLLALSTGLASGVIFSGMALSLVVVLLTLIFGRVFCSWICPLGTMNHGLSALAAKGKRREQMLANTWRPVYGLKYYLLIAFLVLAGCGVVQVGLLDPLALLVRSFAVTVFPGLQLAGAPIYATQPYYAGGWFIGLLFFAILASNLYITRLWCRMLCPLGALLGVAAKFSLFRLHQDPQKCTKCHKCSENCHGACNPHDKIRISDCLMCLNCISSCTQGAMTLRFLPPLAQEAPAPNLARRKILSATIGGLAFVPILRTSHGVGKGAEHALVRPPGALEETDFAAKCIKCGACIRVCPTGVIQPATFEGGLEGLWTPVLRFDLGSCTQSCTLCSQVCPTGALRPLTPEERLGHSPPQEPIRLGTAFIDRGRCLPWSMATPCIVCEEVCPTSPKAIWVKAAAVTRSDGSKVKVQLPHVDPQRCIGCGVCQFRCPVRTKAAIRISSVGESRSSENKFLIKPY
jgi:polyferredoxin